MDQAAVQALVDAAVAAAIANIPPPPPAPPIPPIPPPPGAQPPAPFSLTPGLISTNVPWDYSTRSGQSLYFAATKPVATIFDGKQTSLKVFLQALKSKADAFGWTDLILMIPDSSVPPVERNMLTHFGTLTIENVVQNAIAHYATHDNRSKQAASQLATCILASIDASTMLKLLTRTREYTLAGGFEDGPTMLRCLISVVTIETRATVSCVRAALGNLPAILTSVGSDITAFNLVVSGHLDTLRSVDRTDDSLLTNLFAAYQLASDASFVKYIADKESSWEEGSLDIEPENLMQLAEDNYKTKTSKAIWNKASKEEVDLIALRAETHSAREELVALQANINTSNTDAKKKASTPDSKSGTKAKNDWAWKLIAPTGTQAKEKSFKGKDYIYCQHHGMTKWVLKSGHKDGCRNASNDGDKTAKTLTADGAATKKKGYVRALMHALQEEEDDSLLEEDL